MSRFRLFGRVPGPALDPSADVPTDPRGFPAVPAGVWGPPPAGGDAPTGPWTGAWPVVQVAGQDEAVRLVEPGYGSPAGAAGHREPAPRPTFGHGPTGSPSGSGGSAHGPVVDWPATGGPPGHRDPRYGAATGGPAPGQGDPPYGATAGGPTLGHRDPRYGAATGGPTLGQGDPRYGATAGGPTLGQGDPVHAAVPDAPAAGGPPDRGATSAAVGPRATASTAPPDPPDPRPAFRDPRFPDPAFPHPAEAAALAGAFAVDYLSWDEDDPARRGRVLRDYLRPPVGDATLLGWSGTGRQRGEFALPGLVRPDGDGRVLVDVRVRVTPYRAVGDHGPEPAQTDPEPGIPAVAPAPTGRGWRSLASCWVRLSVPVAHEGTRLVVDASEETLGLDTPDTPEDTPPPATDHALVDDDPLADGAT